jgi:hypothetical protein
MLQELMTTLHLDLAYFFTLPIPQDGLSPLSCLCPNITHLAVWPLAVGIR